MAPRERTLKCMTRMSTWMKFQTSVAVALVQAADHLDEALLTSLYLPLSRTLGVTPTGLGGLSLARSLVKVRRVACCPAAALWPAVGRKRASVSGGAARKRPAVWCQQQSLAPTHSCVPQWADRLTAALLYARSRWCRRQRACWATAATACTSSWLARPAGPCSRCYLALPNTMLRCGPSAVFAAVSCRCCVLVARGRIFGALVKGHVQTEHLSKYYEAAWSRNCHTMSVCHFAGNPCQQSAWKHMHRRVCAEQRGCAYAMMLTAGAAARRQRGRHAPGWAWRWCSRPASRWWRTCSRPRSAGVRLAR